jgi:hypothetical protein
MPLINFNREKDNSTTIIYFLVRDLKLYNYLEKKSIPIY